MTMANTYWVLTNCQASSPNLLMYYFLSYINEETKAESYNLPNVT